VNDTIRRSRAPIDTSGGRPPTTAEFATARRIVTSSGVLPVLQGRVDHVLGRRRSLSVEGLLVAMQINGLRRHHQATVAEFARVLNSFSHRQRSGLGIRDWDPKEAYDRADRLFNLLSHALEEGWDAIVAGSSAHIDASWIAQRLLGSSLQDMPVWSTSVAVDGTDIDTWGRLQGQLDEADLDGDVGDERDPYGPTAKRRRGSRRARILGIGPDGRNIYTNDPDARAGHRSATSSRDAGLHVGYECHIGVLARDTGWSDGVERLKLGPDVPPVITMTSLVPAGSRRDDAIVPNLVEAKTAGLDIKDVIWDRGYSQLLPERTTHPLNQVGIQTTFRPKDPQRISRPFSEDAFVIEGHLVSSRAPKDLRRLLPMPPMGASAEECARYEEAFNQLARYRFECMTGPDADGATRWRCPFHAGRLRSRQLPATMRGSRNVPLVPLHPGTTCCNGTVTVSAAELPHRQRFFPGTTAWRISYGRRQVVEGVNAMLKGGFVDIQHKFFRILGLTKMTLMLAFTVVGYNLEAIRSFGAKKVAARAAIPMKKTRKKRRMGTWRDVVAIRPATGPDPPPG
jgi:hypothetical protein